jgi:dTDP-4-amino-4,6-dideoxygalactose transaminase
MIPITKPQLGNEEIEAVKDAILSGWVTQGPKVKEFEDKFAAFVGAKHACAISNCTCALHAALLAIGVRPGDSVVTVSHSFIATANAIRHCGAEPIFVDIEPDTLNMSPEKLELCLSEHPDKMVKAVLVVHQIGLPCNLKEILRIAGKYGKPVIEDAACAAGSEVSFDNGKTWEKIGRPHGVMACFSFHPRKILTTGEGGMITTNDEHLAEKLRSLRHQGMSVSDLERHSSNRVVFEKYTEPGYNYRMTDIQAAIGIEQLKKLPWMIKQRRSLVEIYMKEFSSIAWLKLPEEPPYARTNWQSFPIVILDNAPLNRDDFMQYLLDRGIATRPGIMNAHEQGLYKLDHDHLMISGEMRRSVVLLPLFQSMAETDIQNVIKVIKSLTK